MAVPAVRSRDSSAVSLRARGACGCGLLTWSTFRRVRAVAVDTVRIRVPMFRIRGWSESVVRFRVSKLNDFKFKSVGRVASGPHGNAVPPAVVVLHSLTRTAKDK